MLAEITPVSENTKDSRVWKQHAWEYTTHDLTHTSHDLTHTTHDLTRGLPFPEQKHEKLVPILLKFSARAWVLLLTSGDTCLFCNSSVSFETAPKTESLVLLL